MLRSASIVVLTFALVAAQATAQTSSPRTTAKSPDEPGRASQRTAHARRAPDEPAVGPEETDTQTGEDARTDRARANRLADADIALAPVHEVRRATRHTATIGGRALAYTATAGTLTVRNDEGKPTASMFYVAYTAGGGAPDPHRPVTFFYNGGPGSSTLWLHMGSLGPVRVTTDSPQATAGPPFRYGNNPDSLLDTSDLVFLDAVGTGFSRPLGDTKLEAFWNTDADIDAFARGIERYLTANGRWNSPKFLFGESYGTTRSAGLSYRLAQDGAQLNGVMLLSSILNYGRRDPGFDRELVNYIPTYATTAAYHHRIAATADAAYLRQVRDWANGPYAQALSQGQGLSEAERQRIAQQMSAYTGLSTRFILDSDLRVEPDAFRKELLRDQRRTLGRYDSRFTGIDVSAAGDSEEFDPSDTGITGAFVSSFHDYLARDLGFATELTYRPTYYQNGLKWSFEHRAPGSRGPYGGTTQADVALDLSAAMRQNPHLQVYSLNGLYDMATPFFGTEYDLNHMQLDRTLHANLHFGYYPSGHMVYLNQEAARAMKADLVRFYAEAAPR